VTGRAARLSGSARFYGKGGGGAGGVTVMPAACSPVFRAVFTEAASNPSSRRLDGKASVPVTRIACLKIRQSKYVRDLNRISLDGPCLFHFLEITEFSKGESREDFNGAYSDTGTTHIINLANALHFELDLETVPPALIELAGPRVVCTEFPHVGRGENTGQDYCENAWNSMFEGMDHWRFYGRTEQNTRRQKAMALIKKTCPGKP
jgi:hypothetical protein